MSSTDKTDHAAIEQFCAVTGADEDTAVSMLEACNGNLEMAVGMQLDGGSGGADALATTSNSAPSGSANTSKHQLQQQDDVRMPIPQKHEVLVQEESYGFRGRRRKAKSVFDGFRDFQAEAMQQEASTSGNHKKRCLEDLFRPPLDLLHRGSFESARGLGVSQNKWVLINIQNVQEFSCQVLNRDIWSHEQVKRVIKKNCLFWQVYHDSLQGSKYCQFYKVNSWPYVAVIDPLTGEEKVSWSKIESSSCFIELLTDFLISFPTPVEPSKDLTDSPPCKRSKKSHSIVDDSEESQLEAAIRASMQSTSSHQKPNKKLTKDQVLSALVDSDEYDDSEYEDNIEPITDSEDSSDELDNKAMVDSSSISNAKGSSNLPSNSRECVQSTNTQKGTVHSENETTDKLDNRHHSSTLSQQSVGDDVIDNVVSNGDKFDTRNAGTEHSGNTHDSGTHSRVEGSEDQQQTSSDTSSTVSEHRCEKKEWRDFIGAETDEQSVLMIRLPDGKRLQWSVSCHSKIEALNLYIHEEGFPLDRFELLLHYPRRQISNLDPMKTLKDVGMFPRETVFVQEKST